MVNQESNYFRPLCPTHYKVTAPSHPIDKRERAVVDGSDAIDVHHWECSLEGCPQNYSASFGYFTTKRNDDYWVGTGSSSLQIRRSPTQVICGEHKDSMFLESWDAKTNLQNFCCPRKNCQNTVKILAGGPAAYWLGEGYFRTP